MVLTADHRNIEAEQLPVQRYLESRFFDDPDALVNARLPDHAGRALGICVCCDVGFILDAAAALR